MHLRVIATLAVLVLAGCTTDPGPTDDDDEQVALDDPIRRFIVLGDMGTGEQPQLDVAAAMKNVCDELGCDFVIGTGDNIYEVGVTSPYDVQFEQKFEAPYAEFDIPFYMSLGNHDNAGVRSGHATGDFQVDYHHRSDKTSDKWQMPARWYLHEQDHLRFIALDTNIVFQDGSTADPVVPVLTQDPSGTQQAAWLDATIPASNWTFLYGHHPIYSNGDHGDAGGNYKAWIQDAVCSSGHVDVFFSGHDHDLQWLKPKDDCGATQFIISGAGGKQRSIVSNSNDVYFACGDIYGFMWVQVHGDHFTGRFYDVDGDVLFERAFSRGDPGGGSQTFSGEAKRCKSG